MMFWMFFFTSRKTLVLISCRHLRSLRLFPTATILIRAGMPDRLSFNNINKNHRFRKKQTIQNKNVCILLYKILTSFNCRATRTKIDTRHNTAGLKKQWRNVKSDVITTLQSNKHIYGINLHLTVTAN